MPTSSTSVQSVTPDWFNKDYLESTLQTFFGDNSIKVISYTACPASTKGENYICIVTRITVSYGNNSSPDVQTGSYILKATLEGEVKAAFDTYGAYDHEIQMYNKILPVCCDILRKNGITEKLAPRAIRADSANQTVILEDLKSLDYVMYDIKNGLDLVLAKKVIHKLALMHAASAVVNSENPGIFANYNHGILNKHSRTFDPLFTMNFEQCARSISKWQGFEKYGDKMLKLVPHFVQYGVEVMQPKDHHFNALIHGDIWCNNIMWKFNENNEADDVLLFDFQFSSWASPTIDLHYFFHTSLSEDVRDKCIEELVQYYYVNLRETLEKLKFTGKIPSLRQFWRQYMDTMDYALFSLAFAQALLMKGENEATSLGTLMTDSEHSKKQRASLYETDKMKRILQRWIPVLDRYGLLELH